MAPHDPNREFERIAALYDLLNHEADANGIFEGSMYAMWQALNLPMAYYKRSYDLLVVLGSVEILQKGNRIQQSKLRIGEAPTREAFDATYKPRLTRSKSRATLQREVDDLRRRLPDIDLEAFIRKADSMLADHEARLENIEQREGHAS